MKKTLIATALAFIMIAPGVWSQQAQSIVRVDNNDDDGYNTDYDYGDRGRIDRYLGAEVWTNHNDGEYYSGDRIEINYRTNRDAFVAIYSIDTRGRVNLLFPAGPNDDNFVQGGVTYSLPGPRDDYDLVVQGPQGAENIQMIASREPFPIPDWYPTSGLVCDTDDRFSYMDWVNDRFFVRYGGQRFGYDRTSIYVNDWDDYYFQPIYRPIYHPWTITGNLYIDYPFGGSVYINGIYWGCAPLYIPRVWVGWSTVTIYDRWGYCWESDVHISRYHTLVLDNREIHTSPTVRSKYREVVTAGYRDPIKNGYPDYTRKVQAIETSKSVTTKKITIDGPGGKKLTETMTVAPKKHVKGTTEVIKTDRGYETAGIVPDYNDRSDSKRGYDNSGSDGYSRSTGKRETVVGGSSSGSSSGNYGRSEKRSSSSGSSNSDYYQRKSSGSTSKSTQERSRTVTPSSKGKSSGGSSAQPRSSGGSSSGGSVQQKGKSGGSSSSGRSGGSSKSSGGSNNSGGSSKSGGSKGKGRG